ncbi:MAG: twin-arginine translocase TatA/TatE family subunit [Mailhella sp.]|nr:twin-arginine translocase TatA/TatE family subunit [Mailhella sp.]
MLGGIGTQELLLIFLLVIIVFGAKKLPEIGRGLGTALRDFKKATQEPSEIDVTPKKPGAPKNIETGEKAAETVAKSEETAKETIEPAKDRTEA